MCNLFRAAVADSEFLEKYHKVIWNKQKYYSDYAFVVYDPSGEYIDSVDPVEQIFKINDRIFIKNNMCIYETDISNLQNVTCRIEEAHYNYQCDNINCLDIKI